MSADFHPLVFILWQGLLMEPRMASKSIWITEQPWTSDPPASNSWVLRLQAGPHHHASHFMLYWLLDPLGLPASLANTLPLRYILTFCLCKSEKNPNRPFMTATGKTNPPDTQMLGSQPPELWINECLWLKSTTVLTNTPSNTSVFTPLSRVLASIDKKRNK